MEQYLCVGGVEIINKCRDTTYLMNGGHPAAPQRTCHVQSSGCCWDDPDLGPYLDPVTDDAPWYDPLVPDSADILGIHVESMRLSSPWKRSFNSNGMTSVASSGGYGTRELVVTGWLLTRSCCATELGRQWLFEALAQPDYCAEGCSPPSAVIRTCDWREMRGAALTSFEWQTDDGLPCCFGAKFSFTLQFEQPYIFVKPDSPVFDGELANDVEICVACEEFDNLCPESTVCCECGACNDCLNCMDCNPLKDAFAQNPVSDYCPPISVFRNCFTFVPGAWEVATLVLTVNVGPELYPGGPGLKNLRLRAWPNPLGLPADDPSFYCPPCIALEISCLPANSQFVFDGTSREAYVVCGGRRNSAYKYLSSNSGPVEWPMVSCIPLMVCIESDSYNTGASSATVEWFGVERG